VILAAAAAPSAPAQVVFGGEGSYFQSFDGLANTGPANAWTNNVVITGVFAFQSIATPPVPTYRAGNGAVGTADLMSFGVTGSPDRALGSIASGATGNFAYGFVVQNTSPDFLSFSVSYTGEQWRDGGDATPNAQALTFSYRTTTTLPTAYADWSPDTVLPSGYSSLSSLDFTSPTFTDTGAGVGLNGNAAANRQVFPLTLVPGVVAPGEYLLFRWLDVNNAGNNHGLGIDNLSIEAIIAVPEPATVLGIAGAGLAAGGWVRRRRRPAA
jgi:hypothetical protein